MTFANKYLFVLFLAGLFTQCVISQQIGQQYKYASSLYNNEEYFNAVTEFKRLLFFDTSGTYRTKANFFIGKSYKAGGYYSESIRYFTNAVLTAETPYDIFVSKIEIIKSNILRRTFSNAHILLDELEESADSEQREEINYWRGWVYMFSDEWDKAAEIFNNLKGSDELAELAEKTDSEKYSVTAAKIMSIILPGTGQFYTGNYVSGVLSLGWNALWGYLTINAFINDRIFDGFVVANFLWLRFYNGNIHNAVKFATDKNIKINNEAFRYLKNQYTGSKPED